MVAFDLLGSLPMTPPGNAFLFLVVDLFSRHTEDHAITGEKNDSAELLVSLVNDLQAWGVRTLFYLIGARTVERCTRCNVLSRSTPARRVLPSDQRNGGEAKASLPNHVAPGFL